MGTPDLETKYFKPIGEKIVIKETTAFGKTYKTILQLGKDPNSTKAKIKLRISQPVFGKTKNNPSPHWRGGNKVYLHIKDLTSLKRALETFTNGQPISLTNADKELLEKQFLQEPEKAKSAIKNLGEAKKVSFKKEKKQYEKYLLKLKQLINKKDSTETDLQNFLNDKPLFFGLDYNPEKKLTAMPQKMAGKKRFDFFIERYNGQSDIVELKSPNVNIFNKDGKICTDLAKAIDQTINYIEFCIHQEKYLRDEEGIIVDKPKGIIIIGAVRNEKENKALKNIEYYFNHVEILTYNEFYKKSKSILENAKKHLA